MAFPGEQPGRRIQTDPTRAGQIHLAPGVQVSEVLVGARRPIKGFDVSAQLNQVAGHKTRSQAKMTQ
ncbi:hypothetical protein D3C77_280330 [compost metagenome]